MESSETKTFIKVWSAVVASLCYCYFIATKIPRCKIIRLLSLLPILSLFTLIPLSFSSCLLTGQTAWFLTWLANFKLILLSFNHGPLSRHPCSSSLLRFILVAALPIKIKDCPQIRTHQRRQPSKIFPNLWSKIISFYAAFYVCDRIRDRVPAKVLQICYCCLLFLLLDHAMCVCNSVVRLIFGLELDPPFDEPYLSTSLQDFWGRRWNLMVSEALRNTVYFPLRWTFGGHRWWARGFAVIASFVVSGLMHELLVFYMTRVSPTWEITWFFVLHGLCVVLEMGLKRRWKVHWALSGPLTIGFLVVSAFWLFFPQIVRNRVDVRVMEEIKSFVGNVKGLFL